MMGIGFPELMIILVIIMIIFGAGKLPEIGSAFGNSIRNFKKSMKEAEEITEEASVTPELEGGEAGQAEEKDAETPVTSETENKG
jgi:sec-independent protein translocase protein TatA